MPEKVSIATRHLCVYRTDLRLTGWIIQAAAKTHLPRRRGGGPPDDKDATMTQLDPNQEPGRLEELDFDEVEAAIRRGRTLQARAMGLGLRALFRAVVFGEEPDAARTERGEVDWERLLGLEGGGPARGASR
jgi:hypothetical protein